jgi:release factor glutamine methyltransferase
VAARERIPFGPVMMARTAFLERAGHIEPGQRYEELVVVRGIAR